MLVHEDHLIAVASQADIVLAREQGRALATKLGFSGTESTMIATAISELARNILQYAGHGEVILKAMTAADTAGIAVTARDEGPGISDISLAMERGYSTSGGLGLGLPGVRQIMDEFRIESSPGRGTVVTATKWQPGSGPPSHVDTPQSNDRPHTIQETRPIEVGIARMTMPGQQCSADRYVVKQLPREVLVAVIDGLGHGREAEQAAEAAVRGIEATAGQPLVTIVQHCHEALRTTRGVVMSIASIDAVKGIVTWVGVGNVTGVLLRFGEGKQRLPLLQRAGVVGYRMPVLQPRSHSIAVSDTLVFATDGIRSGFDDQLVPGNAPQKMADQILHSNGGTADDALVLVVRFLGARP